jgi:hypothetical protein
MPADGCRWRAWPSAPSPLARPCKRIEAGIRLVYQPPYTPEVQPAEHLWPLVDEPIVNKHIASLDHLEAVVASRCYDLADDPATIASTTNFHWWPAPANPS